MALEHKLSLTAQQIDDRLKSIGNVNQLETSNKEELVTAINEVNRNTVDKMAHLDLASGNNVIDSCDERGIGWYNDEYEIENAKGECHYGSKVRNRVPIVAGNNIEFVVDEENQVVKINATGGGSDGSVVGTWVFNEDPQLPTESILLSFTSNGINCNKIEKSSIGPSHWNLSTLDYKRTDNNSFSVYLLNPPEESGMSHGWIDTAYKTIVVTGEPEDAYACEWLKANAVKSTLNEADKHYIAQNSIPQYDSTADEGKFFRVVGGVAGWYSVPNVEEVEF